MQTSEVNTVGSLYTTCLKQINWKGFPEDQPDSMKEFIAAMSFDEVADQNKGRLFH